MGAPDLPGLPALDICGNKGKVFFQNGVCLRDGPWVTLGAWGRPLCTQNMNLRDPNMTAEGRANTVHLQNGRFERLAYSDPPALQLSYLKRPTNTNSQRWFPQLT